MSLFRADSVLPHLSSAQLKFEFKMEVAMRHKKIFCFALVFACLVALPQQFLWAGSGAAPVRSVAVAGTHTAGPGTKVIATYTQKPPTLTPEQAKQIQEEWAEADREGPRQPIHPAPMTTAVQRGPEGRPPNTPAPGDFDIYRHSVIPSGG